MNCSESERLFDPYLDNELSGSLRLEFDAHRLRCALCQRKLAMLEACEHILAGDQRGPELSPKFTDEIMSELIRRRANPRSIARRRWTIATAVVLQAAAVIGFVAFWPGLRKAVLGGGASATPPSSGISIEEIAPRNTGPGLGDLIARGARGVWGAKTDLTEGVSALPRYAMGLTLASDLGDSGWSEPLSWLLGIGGLADPESRGGATDDDTETFSL